MPKAMEGLVGRGLVVVSPAAPTILGTRAHFTPAGLRALRDLLRHRRAMDPKCFDHLRRELSLDPLGEDAAA